MTIFAFALLTGAFLYVSVIGSRISETTRARVAADATAMAAATIKARVMNYEAFLLMSESILLPLAETTANIRKAQLAMILPCIGFVFFETPLAEACLKYPSHMSQTKPGGANTKVNEWLQGLEATAILLDAAGPQWASYVATRTGMHSSYLGTDGHGVSLAAAYPLPGLPACRTLGIKMENNNKEVNDDGTRKSACHDHELLQILYIGASLRPEEAVLDGMGLTILGHMLSIFGHCSNPVTVPTLGASWKDYSVSRGMALVKKPSDRWFLSYLEALRGSKPPAVLGSGYLLGKSCAEHYSQDHYSKNGDTESLFHMDWRARMVPCNYESVKNTKPIFECAVPGIDGVVASGGELGGYADIPVQFAKELALGMQKNWKY